MNHEIETALDKRLTPREKEYLALLGEGLSNPQIAERLTVALSTVKWTLRQVYGKLGAKNRKDAVAIAREIGLLDAPARLVKQQYHLPPEPNAFIGRAAELAMLNELIANPAVRLITINGAGGMGKTRLALALAHQVMANKHQFAHGVVFVPLAAFDSAESLVPAIASALNLTLESGNGIRTPEQQVTDFLRRKQLLLILDNYEQLLPHVQVVIAILQTAPDLNILVTSRERLQLQEEHCLPLAGLTYPDWKTAKAQTNEQRDTFTAFAMFTAVAQRLQPDYQLNTTNIATLTQICRMLEGMPLAIELAAGWLDVLSLEEILIELQQNVGLLETKMGNIPPRHRSMRAMWQGTWARLNPTEQTIFAQLAIFRDGFTREAAQAITNATFHPLAALTNKSLLTFDRDSNRYSRHELLRQFSEEQLLQHKDLATQVTNKHANYYIAILLEWYEQEKEQLRREPFDQTSFEIENITVACQGILFPESNLFTIQPQFNEIQMTTVVLALGKILGQFGRFEEAIHYYQQGLFLLQKMPQIADSKQCEFELTLALGHAKWNGGHVTEAMSAYEKSIEIGRTLKDKEAFAQAVLAYEEPKWRFNLNPQASQQNMLEALSALGEEESGLRVRLLVSYSRTLLASGKLDELQITVDQALHIARRINDPIALCDALRISVQIDRRPETIEKRLINVEEMIATAKYMGDKERLGDALALYAYDQLELGNIDLVDKIISEQSLLAEKFQHPFQLYMATIFQTMRHILCGAFAAAERFAYEAADMSKQIGTAEFDGILGIHMFTIRTEQARLKEIAPIVKLYVANNPDSATWRPGLALIYAFIGEDALCRKVFEALAIDSFASIPRDSMWTTSLTYLTEACVFLRDVQRAEILYSLLLPFVKHTVVVGAAIICLGAVDRYLGMLASLMLDWTAAERHFEVALALDSRLDAHPWLAHSKYEYAVMLSERGNAADWQRVNNLLNEALSVAQEMGMVYLAGKVTGLQALGKHV